jgi:DNA-binding MarR family transcriptional regulator
MHREDLLTKLAEDVALLRRRMWTCTPANPPPGVPTKAQAGLLFLIAHEDAPTTKALAERIGTTPSAVTQLIDGLIKERLVIRTEDETDRRKVRLSLSDEGKRRLKEMKKIHLEAITKLSSSLSETELDQLHTLLKKMVEPTN